MRFLASLILLAAQVYVPATPNGPTHDVNPAYPLRVQIMQIHWSHNRWGTTGWGRANLVAPANQGFDYTFDCDEPFMTTRGNGFYSGRWKKPNTRLELLEERIGSSKTQKCELKVETKPYVYEFQHGALVTKQN